MIAKNPECKCPAGPVEYLLAKVRPSENLDGLTHISSAYRLFGHTAECPLTDELFYGQTLLHGGSA